MKTLTELSEENGADLDTVHPLATKIIFHDEADLQKLIDAHNEQLSEPVEALLLQDLKPTYCNDSGNILGGFKYDLKYVYLAPPVTTEVIANMQAIIDAQKEVINSQHEALMNCISKSNALEALVNLRKYKEIK